MMEHRKLTAPEKLVILSILQECGPVPLLREISSFVTHSVENVQVADELAGPISEAAQALQQSPEVSVMRDRDYQRSPTDASRYRTHTGVPG